MPWPCAPVKGEEVTGSPARGASTPLPRVLRSCAGYLMVQPVPSTRRHVERWPRGRRRRFAQPLYGPKAVSRVRIPPSPPASTFGSSPPSSGVHLDDAVGPPGARPLVADGDPDSDLAVGGPVLRLGEHVL